MKRYVINSSHMMTRTRPDTSNNALQPKEIRGWTNVFALCWICESKTGNKFPCIIVKNSDAGSIGSDFLNVVWMTMMGSK